MFKLSLVQLLRIVNARSAPAIIRPQYRVAKIHASSYKNAHTKVLMPNGVPQEEKRIDEREYLIRVQNDPEVFGQGFEKEETYKDDVKEEEFLLNPPDPSSRLSTKQYADVIKQLIGQRRIKEAIDYVEIRMIKEDKVKPENYIYNLLIGACGRVGYTKKAFSLYNEMKRRALAVTPGTYTALFNACANSPWPEDGLSRAKHLHGIIVEKRHELNDSSYNAMIKAYGRCGDLRTAFAVVDEMLSKGFDIKDDTLNFVLQACISDRDAGFRHALLVWRKFVDRRIEPSVYSYNLMLRCIRDCGLGDLEVTRDVLAKILPRSDRFMQLDVGGKDDCNVLQLSQRDIQSHHSEDVTPNSTNNTSDFPPRTEEEPNILSTTDEPPPSPEKGFSKPPVTEIIQNRPNLMALVPHMGDIVSLSEVKTAEDRLLLVGGVGSFLKDMEASGCVPNIKTFSQLLECAPGAPSPEKELVLAMKKANVKPDVDFFNMLIRKRSMRRDYEGAREVLRSITKCGYKPNLITYGVLSLGCKNRMEARGLLDEMREGNYRLNIQILGAMLQQACFHWNFGYVLEIMEMCREEEIAPNQIFMEHLEKFKKKTKDASNDPNNELAKKPSFQKGYQIFRLRYKTWRQQVHAEEEDHPWQQFRQPTSANASGFKDKSSRFKPRHASLFRQKTIVENVNMDHRKRWTRKPKAARESALTKTELIE